MFLLRFLLLCAAILAAPCLAMAANDAGPALHRGLNLSSWLANAPRQPLTARDFAQIKEAGFDHIRLPFNPNYYGFKFAYNEDNAAQMDFTALDRAIALAEHYRLPVILDIHPGGEFLDTMEHNDWAEDQFVNLWQVITLHYKNEPAGAVLFELLNEPQYYKWETRWTRLAARLIETIHATSPDRYIIVGAPHGSSIDALSFLHPYADPHIIYAFHFYLPYLVTHQGIHQGFEKKSIRYFRNLPYPSSLATGSAAHYAPEAPNPAQAQSELQDYIDTPWDAAQIAARLEVAHAWARQYNVRVLCGEFGVLRNHIDPESRYRWIRDARTALDKDAIGWELWDYTDLFGIAPPTNPSAPDPVDGSVRMRDDKGARLFEPQALDALGLNAPSAEITP